MILKRDFTGFLAAASAASFSSCSFLAAASSAAFLAAATASKAFLAARAASRADFCLALRAAIYSAMAAVFCIAIVFVSISE